jgi:hypothetical protein
MGLKITASIILFPTLIDKSPDTSNELIRIIFYTKVCNINSDAEANKKGQPKETGKIWYTRHRTNKCWRIPKGL